MTPPDSQEQLESKLIKVPRRVWKTIERIAAGERRGWRDQAAILLERAVAEAESEPDELIAVGA